MGGASCVNKRAGSVQSTALRARCSLGNCSALLCACIWRNAVCVHGMAGTLRMYLYLLSCDNVVLMISWWVGAADQYWISMLAALAARYIGQS